ncbi:MAG: type II toxin-antitoxin system Phd/YefM family antitoxin [Deltaproteobacteria bacterium]|nr:type II toxin-antitoxin system Phd/YefM family antitoxin [Deltaproteobacteria bacterium]
MKRSELRVSEDINPVTDLKAHAATWIETLATRDAPIVVTQHGRAAAVLLSPRADDALTSRARFVSAVEEGLRDADAGRTIAHRDVAKEMTARYGAPKPAVEGTRKKKP